jgi:hypothetical protein
VVGSSVPFSAPKSRLYRELRWVSLSVVEPVATGVAEPSTPFEPVVAELEVLLVALQLLTIIAPSQAALRATGARQFEPSNPEDECGHQ